MDDQSDQTSGMAPQYMESHSYGSENIYAGKRLLATRPVMSAGNMLLGVEVLNA